MGGFSVTPTLAGHFRVIAPDTRGHGRTAHPGGSIPYTQLADDVVGLMTATIVGFRHPKSVRAIVNYAGYDTLNPQAPSMPIMRQNLGGGPNATRADPDVPTRAFDSSEQMRAVFELVKADHDAAHGPGYWKTHCACAEGRSYVPVRASLGTPVESRIL